VELEYWPEFLLVSHYDYNNFRRLSKWTHGREFSFTTIIIKLLVSSTFEVNLELKGSFDNVLRTLADLQMTSDSRMVKCHCFYLSILG